MEDIYRFRFWLDTEKRWLYFGSETFHTYKNPIERAWADGEKIYQYIGKKDKNGKLIYEGDYIKATVEIDDEEDGRIVIHHKGAVVFKSFAFLAEAKDMTYHLIPIQNFKTIEIIGNIYENPDLLEDN